MNLPSIHNKGKDNNLVLSEQKNLELVQALSSGVRVSDTSTKQLVDFLSFQIPTCYQLAGLKKLTEQDLAYMIKFVYQETRRNFSNLTSEEIELAFQSGICGEYGDYNKGLSATTFIQFLKAYKQEKAKLQNSIIGRIHAQNMKTHDIQENAEQIHSFNQEFLKKKYQEFTILVEEGEKRVNNSCTFSVELDQLDISSYTSAIEQEEGKLHISSNQMNWVNKKVDSLSFEFDPYKFGTGLQAKKSFEKFKNQESSRLFKSLVLQIHFGNKVSRLTGVSMSSFLKIVY